MITNLLWLFKPYRDLVFENAALRQTIADLDAQLSNRPDSGLQEMIKRHQEEVLSEQPFPDGKIPDNLWLT